MKPSKILAIAITMLLFASVFNAAFIIKAQASLTPPEFEPIAIDDNVKNVEIDSQMPAPLGGEASHYSAEAKDPYWTIGESAIWLAYGSGYPSGWTYFTLSYIGTSIEIWVQNSIKYPAGDFRNGIPLGSPGPTKPTYAMLEYFANQFETNILPEESAFFGAPLFHDGSNAQTPVYYPGLPGMTPDYYSEPTGRTVILVSNIRDYSYYHSDYPYYVIGSFVSSFTDFYFDRNMVNIDAVSWFHGLGTAGTVWGTHLYAPNATYAVMHDSPVTSPYAYDSTLAHEWQHLLHHELCPGDDLFMNEGCSMYAEYLCGYGIDPDYPNSYFATPDNSLTEWGDQGDINILADYGNAGLWTIYLNDQFGSSFLQYYFSSGGGGMNGITAALAHFKYKDTADDVYHDWKLANLIRADFPGCGKYNYKSFNFNDPAYIPVRIYETSGLPVPKTKGTDFGNTITILGYDTEISRMTRYGTDYVSFSNWPKLGLGFLYFDGDDTSQIPPPFAWTYTDGEWYSGTGVDLVNEAIAGTAYVDTSNPTLTITTLWDLEDYWDYGFIQVSTDGGHTWTSLANEYTTYDHDPAAHPDVVANLPGLTSYPDPFDYVTMEFDLTAYAGQNVLIGFRYVTDWGTTYGGWWISSADVSGTALTLAPFTEFPPEADFQVTVVQAIVRCGKTIYVPFDMKTKDATEKGMAIAYAKAPSYVVLVVTPIMLKGDIDYEFQATKTPLFKFLC